MILISRTHGVETLLHSLMFYGYFNFLHKLNSHLEWKHSQLDAYRGLFIRCQTCFFCVFFSKHAEVKEDGMEVEEGEMGDEDAPAPW